MAIPTTYVNPNQTLAAGGLEGAATNVITAVFWNRLAAMVHFLGGTGGYIAGGAHQSGTQSIPDSAATVVNLGAEHIDSDPNGAVHDNVTNNSRLTIRTTGLYHFGAWLQWATSATGYRYVMLRLNGAAALAQDTRGGTSGTTTDLTLYRAYPVSAGDYVELVVIQTSGGALTLSQANLTATKA